MNPEVGKSSSDENYGGYSFEQTESGIYVPKGKQISNEIAKTQKADIDEPQVPSQNEVDLSQYEEVFVVDPEEAAKKYMETGQTSPLVTVRSKTETSTTPTQEANTTTKQEADAIPSQPTVATGTPTLQENEDDLRYRKALNSVQNGDRTLIAEDKRRYEQGEGAATIMEDDEAKRYEQTLQDIEKRNQQPPLTKLEQSLQRDKAEMQQKEATETAEKERKHQEALDRNRELNRNWRPSMSDGILRMEQDANRIIQENQEFEKNFTYVNKENKRVEIPLPIREQMTEMFGSGTQIQDPKTAEKYAVMENDLYNQRYNEKVAELKNRGFDDATIDAYMKIAKYEIKNAIQEDVKTMVTNDFLKKVIDRIEQDPEKYKDFIDPTTGKVKESLSGDIGLILEQKIYTSWMVGEKPSQEGETTPAPTPETTATSTSETTTNQEGQPTEAPRPDTPEERLTRLNSRINELTDKTRNKSLTPEEALELAQLMTERDDLQKTLAEKEDAEAEKRKKKNRWLKIIAGVAGAGIALATPAVSVAALMAITLGGRYIGKGLDKWGEHLRNKARDIQYQIKDGMTPEQIEELEKKQGRNKWWGERLSEISSVLIGGTTGYGIGKALQNIIEIAKAAKGQIPTTAEQPSVDNAGDLGGNINQSSGIGRGESSTDTINNIMEGTVTDNTNWFNEGQQWWDTSKYGWNPVKYGWNSSNVALEGSKYGDLQGSLLQSLSSKVPESVFYKPGAQDLVHRALATLYEQGVGSVNAISDTLAQGLQALP